MALGHGLARCGLGVLALAHVLACSDDGVPADDPSGASTSATDPTGTTNDATTVSGTSPESGTTSPESTGPESTGPDPTTNDVDTTAASTGPGDSSDSGSTDTGTTGDPSEACEQADDCVVVDNCCECTVLPAGVDPAMCNMPCDQTQCSALGIDPVAQCELGSCELAEVPCNPLTVTCDSIPPKCPEGTRASIDPVSECWTGECVPVEICDVVESCDDCPDDEVCVESVAHFATITCSPIPPECNGVPSCACMGDAVCISPFDACGDDGDGISCGCPVC